MDSVIEEVEIRSWMDDAIGQVEKQVEEEKKADDFYEEILRSSSSEEEDDQK